MNQIIKLFSLAVTSGLLLFAGCVSTDVTRISSAPDGLTPISPSEVSVHRDTSSVKCSYSEIALIDTRGGSELTVSNDKLVSEAKESAAELGANGIILESFGDVEMLGSSEPTGKFVAVYEDRPCE